MKDYIEERAVEIAGYIVETKATVRQAAKKFGISKSTVHKDCVGWACYTGKISACTYAVKFLTGGMLVIKYLCL